MGWDSSRPVPWLRLVREWLVYAAIMVAVFAAFYSDNLVNGLVGLLISGPLYLALGVVLAKFGYKRKTIKQMRAERVDRTTDSTSPAATSVARTRPAPTRRTAGSGRSNRPGNRRR
jgi:hypothetical protein